MRNYGLAKFGQHPEEWELKLRLSEAYARKTMRQDLKKFYGSKAGREQSSIQASDSNTQEARNGPRD
jgi:hypothetical protein